MLQICKPLLVKFQKPLKTAYLGRMLKKNTLADGMDRSESYIS